MALKQSKMWRFLGVGILVLVALVTTVLLVQKPGPIQGRDVEIVEKRSVTSSASKVMRATKTTSNDGLLCDDSDIWSDIWNFVKYYHVEITLITYFVTIITLSSDAAINRINACFRWFHGKRNHPTYSQREIVMEEPAMEEARLDENYEENRAPLAEMESFHLETV